VTGAVESRLPPNVWVEDTNQSHYNVHAMEELDPHNALVDPAEVVTQRREAAGLSKRGLARRLAELRHGDNVPPEAVESHRRMVYHWESGEHQPNLGSAMDLAVVLGGEPDDYHRRDLRGGRLVELETKVGELQAQVQNLTARLEALEAGQLPTSPAGLPWRGQRPPG
jgi:transcriptional regulator with XRE-family HTH domain